MLCWAEPDAPHFGVRIERSQQYTEPGVSFKTWNAKSAVWLIAQALGSTYSASDIVMRGK